MLRGMSAARKGSKGKKANQCKERENDGTPGAYKAVTGRVMRVCDMLFYSLWPPKVKSLVAH